MTVPTGGTVWLRLVSAADKPRGHTFTVHGVSWPSAPRSGPGPRAGAVGGITAGSVHDLVFDVEARGDHAYRSGVFRWDVDQGMWGILRATAAPRRTGHGTRARHRRSREYGGNIMIVQWCIKGMHFAGGEADALTILNSSNGLLSAWVRNKKRIRYAAIPPKLTRDNLNRHVNHFDAIDPATGVPYRINSPFVSLSAGTIERDTAAQTNLVHRARWRALQFGLDFGRQTEAFLFTCWVVLAPRPAPDIEGVAEEIRDLDAYRSRSRARPTSSSPTPTSRPRSPRRPATRTTQPGRHGWTPDLRTGRPGSGPCWWTRDARGRFSSGQPTTSPRRTATRHSSGPSPASPRVPPGRTPGSYGG
jgi:hypothetical protein